VPAIPSWLLEPLWDQFAALLPDRPVYHPAHPLGCHKPRIGDRIIFEKLIQVLRFGCSCASIADCACGATTIRDRRNEWIRAGIFADLKTIARESYDRIAGHGPAGHRRRRVHHQGATPRCWPPRWTNSTTSVRSRTTSRSTSTPGTTPGRPATTSPAAAWPATSPIRAARPRSRPGSAGNVERTNAWHNAFNRLQRCHERNEDVIDAFFDLADAIITARRLIREAWTLYRWDSRPARRP